MNYSLTYIGIIVFLVSFTAEKLGLNVAPGEIETTVLTIISFIGAIIAFYGRYRKGDVKLLGVKKTV
jgi:hypothetical protein